MMCLVICLSCSQRCQALQALQAHREQVAHHLLGPQALSAMMTKSNSSFTWSQCVEHHLLFISEFTTDNRHMSGEANKVAEALSCPPGPAPLPATTLTRFPSKNLLLHHFHHRLLSLLSFSTISIIFTSMQDQCCRSRYGFARHTPNLY